MALSDCIIYKLAKQRKRVEELFNVTNRPSRETIWTSFSLYEIYQHKLSQPTELAKHLTQIRTTDSHTNSSIHDDALSEDLTYSPQKYNCVELLSTLKSQIGKSVSAHRILQSEFIITVRVKACKDSSQTSRA